MNLADFTTPELTISPLMGSNAKAVLDELWLALSRSGRLPGTVTLSERVPSKVLYGAVELSGWALLHLRIPALNNPVLAFGQRPEAISWPGCQGAVNSVFLVAAPENDAGLYLAILSSIARLARDPVGIEKLHRGQTCTEIYQFLETVVVSVPQHHSTILTPLAATHLI